MTDITSAYVYAPCRQDSIVRSTTNQLSFRNRKPEKKSKISQVNIGEPIDLSRPTLTNTETATKWFRVYFAEGEEETTNSQAYYVALLAKYNENKTTSKLLYMSHEKVLVECLSNDSIQYRTSLLDYNCMILCHVKLPMENTRFNQPNKLEKQTVKQRVTEVQKTYVFATKVNEFIKHIQQGDVRRTVQVKLGDNWRYCFIVSVRNKVYLFKNDQLTDVVNQPEQCVVITFEDICQCEISFQSYSVVFNTVSMKVLEKLCLHFAMQDLCENARLEIAFEVDYFKWFLLQVNRIKYRTYLGLGTEKEKPLLKKQIQAQNIGISQPIGQSSVSNSENIETKVNQFKVQTKFAETISSKTNEKVLNQPRSTVANSDQQPQQKTTDDYQTKTTRGLPWTITSMLGMNDNASSRHLVRNKSKHMKASQDVLTTLQQRVAQKPSYSVSLVDKCENYTEQLAALLGDDDEDAKVLKLEDSFQEMEKKLESQVYLKESSCCSQSPPDRKEIIHLRSTLETLMEEENTLLRKNNSLRTEIKSIKLREDVKPQCSKVVEEMRIQLAELRKYQENLQKELISFKRKDQETISIEDDKQYSIGCSSGSRRSCEVFGFKMKRIMREQNGTLYAGTNIVNNFKANCNQPKGQNRFIEHRDLLKKHLQEQSKDFERGKSFDMLNSPKKSVESAEGQHIQEYQQILRQQQAKLIPQTRLFRTDQAQQKFSKQEQPNTAKKIINPHVLNEYQLDSLQQQRNFLVHRTGFFKQPQFLP